MKKTVAVALSCSAAMLNASMAGVLHARESDSLVLDAVYTADLVSAVRGGGGDRFYYLDNLDLTADADLDALLGWKGARAFVYVLNNLGRSPNDAVGTAEGVNNIEVGRHGPRLYEAWLDQQLAQGVSIRAGMYDLNSEFYATESAALLIGPPFGIGSELAATGSNGPSIFPSTSLAARLRVERGAGYAQVAILNAKARTLGDRHGIDTSFDEGTLLIGEAGYGEQLSVSAGAWRYSRKADHIYLTDPSGAPAQRRVQGVYGMAEWHAADDVTLFLRGGVSDGRTGPFKAGLNSGLLWEKFLPGRDKSILSIGGHRGWASRGQRQVMIDGGQNAAKAETGFELTASDEILPHVSVQPDVQYIRHPGFDRDAKDAIVTTLRLTFAF